ncbi:ElyC/SanA/YdcF family protein [Microcoleus sp. Pol11C3]|uniref:ElyC/SanA/YdcF family protein n=1 Tax=Microcoleus sp. Pol11C3 TaxID=3055390 RepID=UPI0040409901
MGGGVKAALPPRPWVELAEAGDRIIYGSRLYKQGKASLLILSGGRVDWKGGGPPESADMAEIAQTIGVPSSAILQDPDSHNTYQNAVNVRKILESKAIIRAISEGLRLELNGEIRSTNISPGAVATELTTTISDKDTAARMNELYAIAIDADTITRAITFAIEQPGNVDVNEIILRPTGQEL